jgi:hypothetical protein
MASGEVFTQWEVQAQESDTARTRQPGSKHYGVM